MGFINAVYELSSDLSPGDALKKVAELLTDEGVAYTARDLSIASTSTPFVLFGFQSKMYTRKNWYGINPFAFISAVVVDARQDERGGSKVIIAIGRLRAALWSAFYVTFGSIAAFSLAMPHVGVFVAGWALLAWFANVHFFAGVLIRSEIRSALRPTKG